MPNPFAGLNQVTNRSRGRNLVPNTQPPSGSDTDAPESEPRIIRNSADTKVFPYRGIETHGVDPDTQVSVDPEEADYGITVGVSVEPEPKRDAPVPVYVVSDPDAGSDPVEDWGANREYVKAGECRRILGQNEWRYNTQITNMHATDTLYVMPDDFSDIGLAFPIGAGKTFSLAQAITPVYARCGSTNDIPVAISYEYTLPRR